VVAVQFLAKLLRAGTPRLQELSRELQETASLAALFDNRVEVVAVAESVQPIRMSNVVGHILPPNASSLGKAITAFQPADRREKLLRSYGMWRFTENTVTNRDELDREFARIRSQKFALDREETVLQGVCFGVPISGENGEVVAAISVSIPKTRVRDARQEKAIITSVTAVADQISADFREVRLPRGKASASGSTGKGGSKRSSKLAQKDA
jgi:IclR family acetate operon transcriptional repressor